MIFIKGIVLIDPAKPVTLSNGVELEVSASASPTMADWNSDGFDDLLVGEVLVKSGQSKIRLYLGTGSPPVFLDFVYLQADDSDIVVPAQNY